MQNASTPAFRWEDVARYKKDGRFLAGSSDEFATFWAPRDHVHELLRDLLKSASRSIVLCMFGYDDEELDQIIREKLADKSIHVQLSLDLSQSKGVHERVILAKWRADDRNNSVAIGKSEFGAISHDKLLIVDEFTASGSTNWSTSGETKQNNELTLSRNAARAVDFRATADYIHTTMLQQQHKRLASSGAGE